MTNAMLWKINPILYITEHLYEPTSATQSNDDSNQSVSTTMRSETTHTHTHTNNPDTDNDFATWLKLDGGGETGGWRGGEGNDHLI